jgi:DNA polymerase-3 subunit delta'
VTATSLRLSEIVGNQRPRDLLARALARNRLSPALLFHGPEGIGKLTTGLAVAARLNCHRPADGDACGTCVPCSKIASWNHPDVKVLESEADAARSGRPVFFPDSQATGRAAPRRSERLLIGQVRSMLREIDFRPFEGRWRVILVRHLESDPSLGCANTLLKALEEPPATTLFLLTSSRPERLPPTIRSRCQTLAFQPASRGEVAAFLENRGVPGQEATLRAALSGGCPGTALNLDADGGLRQRDAVLAALAAAGEGDPLLALAAADELLPTPQELPGLLACLATVTRDLMVIADDQSGEILLNIDRRAELERLAGLIPQARAAALLDRVSWCERAVERHVNAGLMLQALLLEAGGHLPAAPLAAPWLDGDTSGP